MHVEEAQRIWLQRARRRRFGKSVAAGAACSVRGISILAKLRSIIAE